MARFIWAVILALLASNTSAQLRKPVVADIPAMQALWAKLKAKLTKPDGETYFENDLKGAELPYLYGVVLSSTPKDQPSLLLIAMSGGSTAEVALEIQGHLKETVKDGTEIMFQGTATDFSKEPFKLTIETDEAIRVHDQNR